MLTNLLIILIVADMKNTRSTILRVMLINESARAKAKTVPVFHGPIDENPLPPKPEPELSF